MSQTASEMSGTQIVGYHNTINKKNCWMISPFGHKRQCDQSLPVSFSTWWCVPVSSISDVLQISCYHGHHDGSVFPVIFCAISKFFSHCVPNRMYTENTSWWMQSLCIVFSNSDSADVFVKSVHAECKSCPGRNRGLRPESNTL